MERVGEGEGKGRKGGEGRRGGKEGRMEGEDGLRGPGIGMRAMGEEEGW